MAVDDDYNNVISLKARLENMDQTYEVICAESGKKCLELLNKGEIPDLILLDIMMPEMTGWSVLDKLKENTAWKDIPIIFLTARTDERSKTAGAFLGDLYIEKPYEIEILKEKIDQIIKK